MLQAACVHRAIRHQVVKGDNKVSWKIIFWGKLARAVEDDGMSSVGSERDDGDNRDSCSHKEGGCQSYTLSRCGEPSANYSSIL